MTISTAAIPLAASIAVFLLFVVLFIVSSQKNEKAGLTPGVKGVMLLSLFILVIERCPEKPESLSE
jgi:hypothetical protein